MDETHEASRPPLSGEPVPPNLEYVSVYELLGPLVRHWPSLVTLPAVLGLVAGLLSLAVHRRYEATTTFTAQVSSSSTLPGGLSGLSSLAGQFGFSLGSEADLSPYYFAAILKSRELASTVLQLRVGQPQTGPQRQQPSLLDVLNVEGRTPAARLEHGITLLHRRMQVEIDKPSGVISLRVQMPSPQLAADVADSLVSYLNSFNLQRGQFHSRAQRRFVEERLRDARQELRNAESEMLSFLESNRNYANSPLLAFQERRLERELQLRQELVLSLAKSYEEARIAEVRDVPVLTIIDSAVPPERKSWPRTTLNVLLAMLVGLAAAFVAAYARAWRPAENSVAGVQYAELKSEFSRAKEDLKKVLHLSKRRS